MTGNRPLGNFLRSRRAQLAPEEGQARRRRTPGLKREDVAERAGISAEWYVKIEQGRAVSPSRETVEALGRALRLDAVDLAHLRKLATAGHRPPFRREIVPDPLRRLIANLPEPAYVTGQRWDILAWNDAAMELFGNFGHLAAQDRNVLRWMLTEADAKALFAGSWHDEARRMVSLFRAAHDLWIGDAAFADLVEVLRRGCPEFDAWWAAHGIAAPTSGIKTLQHATRGSLRYAYASFQANDDPALKLALYTAC
jgi:transcriptional regulator with XRE-family HTH domain